MFQIVRLMDEQQSINKKIANQIPVIVQKSVQDIATAEESISAKNESIVHKTIKKVSQDIDELKMNTAIAAMMTMVNELSANGVTKGDMKYLILLLNPFAPHITEELWEMLGFAAQTGKMCCQAEWPVYDFLNFRYFRGCLTAAAQEGQH